MSYDSNSVICMFYDIIENIQQKHPNWDLDRIQENLMDDLSIAIEDMRPPGTEEEV